MLHFHCHVSHLLRYLNGEDAWYMESRSILMSIKTIFLWNKFQVDHLKSLKPFTNKRDAFYGFIIFHINQMSCFYHFHSILSWPVVQRCRVPVQIAIVTALLREHVYSALWVQVCAAGAGIFLQWLPLSSLGLCMYWCRCAQRASSAMSPERMAKEGWICIAF